MYYHTMNLNLLNKKSRYTRVLYWTAGIMGGYILLFSITNALPLEINAQVDMAKEYSQEYLELKVKTNNYPSSIEVNGIKLDEKILENTVQVPLINGKNKITIKAVKNGKDIIKEFEINNDIAELLAKREEQAKVEAARLAEEKRQADLAEQQKRDEEKALAEKDAFRAKLKEEITSKIELYTVTDEDSLIIKNTSDRSIYGYLAEINYAILTYSNSVGYTHPSIQKEVEIPAGEAYVFSMYDFVLKKDDKTRFQPWIERANNFRFVFYFYPDSTSTRKEAVQVNKEWKL